MDEIPQRRLAIRHLTKRYQVCSRTIDRWLELGILPAPIVIRGRRYWSEAEIDQREAEGMKPAKYAPRRNPANNLPTATP
jgi:predicted DNA-binding transcriptional regulator AlpA